MLKKKVMSKKKSIAGDIKPFWYIGRVWAKKTPHVCPVCGGKGFVSNGFYNHIGNTWITSYAGPEVCQSCNGTGIVWK